ncbi:MAG: DUF924 family protein [Candidatus Sericytochromatia bacterium]
MDNKYKEVLDFWFGNYLKETEPNESKSKMWFIKDSETDKEIKKTFLDDVESALNNLYDDWQNEPESSLALIILLDQFTRNIFRDTPRAFDGDLKALEIALKSIEKGFDKQFYPVKRIFFYLPFEHSENLDIQKKSLELFDNLLEETPPNLKEKISNFKTYAQKHYDVIERFERFPHRNKILNRESTNEEIEFLKTPNSSF